MNSYLVEIRLEGFASYRVEADGEEEAHAKALDRFHTEYSKSPAMSLRSKSTETTTLEIDDVL